MQRTHSRSSNNSSTSDGGDSPGGPLDNNMSDTNDRYQPNHPSSPTTTMGDDDVMDSSMSVHDQRIQMFKDQFRRPGLGVKPGYDHPRKGLPSDVSVIKNELGVDEFGCFDCMPVAGETVALLSAQWYEDAKNWLKNPQNLDPPNKIDNTDLFEYYETIERPGRNRESMKEGEDFVFLTLKNWELLMDWFGGGPCVERKCVNDNGRVVVDLRGLELKVKRSSRPEKFVRHVFSKYDTVGFVKRAVIEEWQNNDELDISMYRVWDYYNGKCTTRMHPDSAQLASFQLVDGQNIMFEEADRKTKEFKWDPEYGAPTVSTNNYDTRRRRPENLTISQRQPVCPGAVGLSNLGNTCFMNSTLQCLSNIWLLRDKFLNDEYEKDMNETNPLGTGGKLARSFGDLMKLIWGGQGDIVSPGGFKSVMAEFKPEFSGYQQHDSQELLSFLLDGLHEDLNRVRKKPITQAVEANGRPDEEVAEDSRRVHRLRNDSAVNDLFEGFYKSTVICPDCKHVSVTFDPFTIVQLPVSRPKQAKMLSLPVAVLSGDCGLPYRSSPTIVRVPTDGYMFDVRNKACIGQAPNLGPDDFILCSVYRDRIEKTLSDFEKVDKLPRKLVSIKFTQLSITDDDELIAFQDPNAKRLRLATEATLNGNWHRPLFPSEHKQEIKDGCPFVEDDIWIGSLENRKFRIRMQVVRRLGFGLWKSGLAYKVQCILDVSPASHSNNFHEKRDGIEENAYEFWGFVKDTSQGGDCVDNCKFELGRFVGSFGSFIGDYPLLSDKSCFTLIGTCTNRDFFSGIIEETYSHRVSSFHYPSKPFSFLRCSVKVSPVSPLENRLIGPKPPPAADAFIAVAIRHRRDRDTIGQPAVFTIPIMTTHKDLYSILSQRFNTRALKRDKQSMRSEVDLTQDPYNLNQFFRVYKKPCPPQDLSQEKLLDDSDENFLTSGQESSSPILLIIEWSKTLSRDLPLYQLLFDPLYGDELSDNENEKMNKLYDSFEMFSEEETLDKTETWYCSNCKGHKEASKKMEFWDLPEVLVVHLKRFSQSQSSYLVDKDDTDIDFPLEGLDLRDRVRNPVGKEDCIYDLVAVSHHYGGLGGGHYIAHARNETNGYWYEFDDPSVRLLGKTSAEAASKVKGGTAAGSAYVLFYVKRSRMEEKMRQVAEKQNPTSALYMDEKSDMFMSTSNFGSACDDFDLPYGVGKVSHSSFDPAADLENSNKVHIYDDQSGATI